MLDKPRFTMRSRVELESIEEKTLAPYASLSRGAHATRRHEEPEHPYRTAFQRDRDRIIHSRAFRRLKHKRQVFLTTESDHYRTRITHTLEVSQLSRTMARALGLNEDLVEAIALGHDLGHTPFGHLGEVVLNEIMSGKTTLPGQTPGQRLGGFKHNYQSVRVVDELEMKYAFKGLNLTAAVREGILKHTRLRRGEFDFPDFQYQGLNFECDAASTLEAQVVAVCDEIAQRTHDLEDGIRAGLVDVKEVRELRIVQRVEKSLGIAGLLESDKGLYRSLLIRGLINALVDDVAGTTLENLSRFAARKKRLSDFDEEIVRFSREMDPLQKELNKFIYKRIIDLSHVQWSDDLGRKLISRLFLTYFRFPEMLPDYVRARVLPGGAGGPGQKSPGNLQQSPLFLRTICDYIAGMTDHFAGREAERLARLHKMRGDDLKLEYALGAHVETGKES